MSRGNKIFRMNFSHDSVLRIRLCRTLARNSLQKELRFFLNYFQLYFWLLHHITNDLMSEQKDLWILQASIEKVRWKRFRWRDTTRFTWVYRLTPNRRTNSELSPAELLFTRKIKSLFDKLLPKENTKEEMSQLKNPIHPEKRYVFKEYRYSKVQLTCWSLR